MDLITAADAEGCGAGLITLTLRHRKGNRLAALWDGLRYAWSRVCSGAAYSEERRKFGLIGFVAVVEVTHGEAGWHPHLHVLVVADSPMSAEMWEALAGRWFARFQRALNRKGLDAVEDRGGLDARPVSMHSQGLGIYLSKLSHEVTSGSVTKEGRMGNRTPFRVLADFLATGLADDAELWWEWEAASHGRRQVTYSRGLRERFRLDKEQDDDEIADEDLGDEDLIILTPESWDTVRHCAEHLITATERDGITGAVVWLNERGLSWSWATAAPRRLPPPPGARVAPGSRALLTAGARP